MTTGKFFAILVMVTGFGNVQAQHSAAAAQEGYAQVARTAIMKQFINEPGIENKDVTMMIVDFPPKSASPAHIHPGPTFGYILEGEVQSVFAGKTYHYKKGDPFYEFANGEHTDVRNTDPLKPAKLLVFYIADKDKPTSVPIKK